VALGFVGALALHVQRERELVMQRRAEVRRTHSWYERERSAEPRLGARSMSLPEGMESDVGERSRLFKGILDHDCGADCNFQELDPGCRLAKSKDRRSDRA
jgi:hypothetical protein